MKKLLFTLLGLAAALTLPAQDFKITHGPWLCDMTEDGVTVLWTTNKPALSWVEATEDDGRSFYAAEHTRHYETVAGRKQAHKTLHAVRLNNLRPGTKYCYRIFSQEVLEWKHGDNVLYGRTVASNVYKRAPFRFRTFPATGTDCSFVILNDIHGRADDMTELCREINFGKHDFVMLNGDMSSSIENEEQLFRDFIDASVNLYASETPILYNRGNHETRGVFADRLHDYFPTRNGRHYQLCKVGSVCFLLLDCGEDKPDTDIEYGGLADYDAYRREECEWLRRAVASETFRNASARVVFLHIPLDGGTWHGSNHLRNLFLPILNEAGINIMFSGHTHRYGFHPANDEVRFPVVVNGNQSYIRCDMTGDRIAIRIVGPGGRVAHTHTNSHSANEAEKAMPCTVSVQGIFCFSEEKPQKSAAAEPEPKLGERRPDMLFDGLDADVEPLGDLPVFQACRAAQQEHPAALLGKSRNAAVDLLAQLR